MNLSTDFSRVNVLLSSILLMQFMEYMLAEYTALFGNSSSLPLLPDAEWVAAKAGNKAFCFCNKSMWRSIELQSVSLLHSTWQILPIRTPEDDFRDCWSPKLLLNELNILIFSPRTNKNVILLYTKLVWSYNFSDILKRGVSGDAL